MRYQTGTTLDNARDFISGNAGFPSGLMAAWDESEGYVAVTELCYRVALAAVQQGVDVIWADLRSHVVDMLGDPCGPMLTPFQEAPGDVLVTRGDWDGSWDCDQLVQVCTSGGPDPLVYLVDSLPAAEDFVERPAALAGALSLIHQHAIGSGSLVVVGSYAVGRLDSSRAVGVGAKILNNLAHTVLCVTHQEHHDGWKFGANMPMSRIMFPQTTWRWDHALIVTGA